MRHRNPHRINDPTDLLEVSANSSHPELNDKYRIWKFNGYTFRKPEELERYILNEGYNIKKLWMHPVAVADESGRNTIIIHVAERRPQDCASEMMPLVGE